MLKDNKETINKPSKLNILLNNYQWQSMAVVFGVTLVLGGIFLWWPSWQQAIDDKHSQVPNLQTEKNEKQIYLNKLKEIENKLESIQTSQSAADFKNIDVILPSERDYQALIVELESLVRKSGFFIKSLNINESTLAINSLPEFQVGDVLASWQPLDSKIRGIEIDLNIVGSGGYSQFKKFLKNVEEHMRLINVITIDFSALSESNFIGQSGIDISDKEYAFKLRTYYYDKDYLPQNNNQVTQ